LISVLFVCLGNICRSPVAEGVFKNLVMERGLENIILCDSAGTAAYHTGSLPDKRMRRVALDRGTTLTHAARQLSHYDFAGFDYIMAMDESNFSNIREQSLQINGYYLPEDRLYLYRLFDPERQESVNVPDPYYDEDTAFSNVYDIVVRSGENFLEYLVEKHSLSVQSGINF
jgi:protein-tyrosine phosphatase